ncbi:Leucine-rich repeat and fibronectin type III domain-containing protein 1 [Trichoplax sp. H2]|nr:Leucine-rich repeat and fibronectin type III domain-containing protein 1 [Trichoplax sp. H2]|eukprot:RDD42300.1 Leucine-rich repeat and fibronectin type III domain-containing protein 1 [Trichoplax sp. H2]
MLLQRLPGDENRQYRVVKFLDENGLTALQDFQFANLSKLQLLYLRSNKIQSIQPYAFSGLKNITEIWLDGNLFHYLTDLSLDTFKSLQHYGLSKNKIRKVNMACSSNITYNISKIDVSMNRITRLTTELFPSFQNFTMLSTFNINDNRLEYIKPNTFNSTINLKELNIRNNRIDTLDFIQPLHKLNIL